MMYMFIYLVSPHFLERTSETKTYFALPQKSVLWLVTQEGQKFLVAKTCVHPAAGGVAVPNALA